MNEIVSQFALELAQTVAVTAEKVTDVFDIVAITTEVADSVLSRYQKEHPELFTPLMKVRTVNLCGCGKCRNFIVAQANQPLSLLLLNDYGNLY